MVTTIKITGDGVFIQSNSFNGGIGGPGGGGRLQQQQQQQQLTEAALGSPALGEPALPGSARNGNGSLDTVDSAGVSAASLLSDTNNNHKGYRNFNHRRYQSDEGPGFIGVGLKNGLPEEGSSDCTEVPVGAEADDTIGPDSGRKRDKFTISFLNTHRSPGGSPHGGKSLLNHKFIVYNSKKPKTSSVLHQQFYQQQADTGSSRGGSPPSPSPYQSHYQQYLYNRLRPSLSTSVLSSPSLLGGTVGAGPNLSRADQQHLLQQQQQHQQVQRDRDQQHLYQNSLFHQQHRALLGTPPAAVPGWAKSTSCLVTSSSAGSSAYNRSITGSPLLLLTQSSRSTPPQPTSIGTNSAPGIGPNSSSISSLSSPSTSSGSSAGGSSTPASGASSSSNSPPPPEDRASPTSPTPPTNGAAVPTSSSSTSPARQVSPLTPAAPSTPTQSPPSPTSPAPANLGQ
ncbi:hypothetical protein ZHAS_00013337 [Anopheles sinensis]|uniref:Uncharacterized protein n=1 Tax=Anopheles sinensis TaxID=74873 RepID=A0A084W5B3_ANOSI|nr:hypothetical protein ZHAS_00013337 [Anopheles sinensis]